MTMRASDAPRKIYNRNSVIHVIWKGQSYTPSKETKMDLEHEVVVELAAKAHGKLRVTVIQKRKGKPTITETWHEVEVPVEHRA